MLIRSKYFVGLAILGIAALAAALVLVLSSSTKDISAQEILVNAQTENTTVTSYRYTMHASHTPQLPEDPDWYETNISATIVFGQGVHIALTRLDDWGAGEYSEALYLDGKQYHRDSADGAWEESSSEFDVDNMGTMDSDKHFQIVDDILDSAVVGQEQLRGVTVNKITGRYDLQKKVQAIWGDPEGKSEEWKAGTRDPRRQMLAGTENFTGWVGVEDGLIHAYEVSATYPAEGELLAWELWYRVDFTDFNQTLTLPSPE